MRMFNIQKRKSGTFLIDGERKEGNGKMGLCDWKNKLPAPWSVPKKEDIAFICRVATEMKRKRDDMEIVWQTPANPPERHDYIFLNGIEIKKKQNIYFSFFLPSRHIYHPCTNFIFGWNYLGRRHVRPYYFEFISHVSSLYLFHFVPFHFWDYHPEIFVMTLAFPVAQVKNRWAGKTIVDLFAEEFKGRPYEYYVADFLSLYQFIYSVEFLKEFQCNFDFR